MTEFNSKPAMSCGFRLLLLGTASAVALSICAIPSFAAEDQPSVWIELGGQVERVDSSHTVFAPPFFTQATPQILEPLVDAQRPANYGVGEEGKLTFVPSGTDLQFSASVRYGRSHSARHLHYQTFHTTIQTVNGNPAELVGRPVDMFGDGQAENSESHLLLDFVAGKDLGLGLFGGSGSSVISAGVRFAQFTSGANINLHARPTYHAGPYFSYPPSFSVHGANFQNNTALIRSTRSLHALGPEISWSASALVVGKDQKPSISFDWGINGAVLFGRQKARVHHQTSEGHFYEAPGSSYPSLISGYENPPIDHNRSHAVVIPNVGGFAGISFRYLNAKLSAGYRADFFFNALDTGIDTRTTSTVGFYGPFATVSIGLGR